MSHRVFGRSLPERENRRGSPAVKTAGGSPITTSPGVARRQVPFFASPKKGTKERRPHLRWPSASRSRQAQAGQCGNSLRFEFQRKRSSNIRIAFTGSTLPSAAASEGEFKSNGKAGTPLDCRGPAGLAMTCPLPRCHCEQREAIQLEPARSSSPFPLSPPAGRGWPGGPGEGQDVALPSPSVPRRPGG